MGIMDKIKRATGTDEQYDDIYDNEYYDGFDDYGEPADGMQTQGAGDQNYSAPNAGGIGGTSFGAPAASFAPASGGISLSGNAIEMKVVKPESFESVTQIADHLIKKRTVVLNLEKANKETARRLVDFLSGVAYSIEGSLTKIAANAYVITPSNVDVGDAQLRTRATEAPAAAPKAEEEENTTFGEL